MRFRCFSARFYLPRETGQVQGETPGMWGHGSSHGMGLIDGPALVLAGQVRASRKEHWDMWVVLPKPIRDSWLELGPQQKYIVFFCLVSGKQRQPNKANNPKGELILGKD